MTPSGRPAGPRRSPQVTRCGGGAGAGRCPRAVRLQPGLGEIRSRAARRRREGGRRPAERGGHRAPERGGGTGGTGGTGLRSEEGASRRGLRGELLLPKLSAARSASVLEVAAPRARPSVASLLPRAIAAEKRSEAPPGSGPPAELRPREDSRAPRALLRNSPSAGSRRRDRPLQVVIDSRR